MHTHSYYKHKVQYQSQSLFEFAETANSHGDGDIHDSVLAVPSQFSEEQRKVFGYEMTIYKNKNK